LTSPSISSLVMSCSSVNPEIKPSSSAMGMLATRTTRGSRVGMCDATNRQRARFGNASEFASLSAPSTTSRQRRNVPNFVVKKRRFPFLRRGQPPRRPLRPMVGVNTNDEKLNYIRPCFTCMTTFDHFTYDN
jgi:hypothetical protein